MVFDTYEKLFRHINEYRETLENLRRERETISEEIKLFYEKNDLGTIWVFCGDWADQRQSPAPWKAG